jgi:hypothetical protein
MTHWLITLAIIGISVVTVVGDYFIKLASLTSSPVLNRWFLAGCGMYLLCTFG